MPALGSRAAVHDSRVEPVLQLALLQEGVAPVTARGEAHPARHADLSQEFRPALQLPVVREAVEREDEGVGQAGQGRLSNRVRLARARLAVVLVIFRELLCSHALEDKLLQGAGTPGSARKRQEQEGFLFGGTVTTRATCYRYLLRRGG